MKCPFCGTENIAGRTHCIACATPLPIVTDPAPMAITESAPQQIVATEPMPTPLVTSADSQSQPLSNVLNSQSLEPLAGGVAMNTLAEPVGPFTSSDTTAPLSDEALANNTESNQAPVVSSSSWLEPNVNNINSGSAMMPESKSVSEMPVPKVGGIEQASQPRINVHFDEKEVEEVQMPVHQEFVTPAMSLPQPEQTQGEDHTVGEAEPHTGPWLALTVLGGGVIVVILIIYFLYRLIVGGSAEPAINPQPSITAMPTPTVSSTPIPQLSVNDVQREQDVEELRIAISSYYRDKQRYPAASTYNGLLNALIGGNYLTRRVQDPAFPGQEYKYIVDTLGDSYEVVITFDTVASTLLQSSGSTVYRLRGSAGN